MTEQKVTVIPADRRVIIQSKCGDSFLSIEVESLEPFIRDQWDKMRLTGEYRKATSDKERRRVMRELYHKHGVRFPITEWYPRFFRFYLPIGASLLLLIISVVQLLK